MNGGSVEAIVRALAEANVRYLIAGGLAVVAHGYVRFTADIDLVLDPKGLQRAVPALEALGYRARAPVPFAEFVDPDQRREWAETKGMTVFSLFSPDHPATEIDLFLEPPVDFEEAYAGASRFEVAPGVPATFVSRDLLIAMKRRAGRPQDLLDVAQLEAEGPGRGSA